MSIPATPADQIAGVLRIHVRPDLLFNIRPTALLNAELGLDSIALTSLAVAFEDYYQITIDDAQIATWHKVGDITATILTQLARLSRFNPYPEPPLPDQQLANGGACS
jgi:acyl carrier protein